MSSKGRVMMPGILRVKIKGATLSHPVVVVRLEQKVKPYRPKPKGIPFDESYTEEKIGKTFMLTKTPGD